MELSAVFSPALPSLAPEAAGSAFLPSAAPAPHSPAPKADGLASSEVDPIEMRARAYVQAAKAPSTLRAYRADWRDFEAWCLARGVAALPATPETVALYLAARGPTHRPATLTRRLTAIARAHEAAGHASPATLRHAPVSETLKGIRRVHGAAQPGKTALRTADLRAAVAHAAPGLLGLRDRALLLVGYAGALRRSELAALAVPDLTRSDDGLRVSIRRSKTDQESLGRAVAIPRGSRPDTCPVAALDAWLAAARITEGAVFRRVDRHGRAGGAPLDPNSIAKILKRALRRAGYAPEGYAGHSLRAGFCTEAARGGASAFDLMRQTDHRSVAMVARYIREAELFRDAPAGRLGL